MKMIVSFGVLTVATALYGDPSATVSSVVQGADKMVTVAYSLENGPAIVTFDVTTNGISIGADKLWCASGDVNRRLASGPHVFRWCPLRSWKDVRIADEQLNLKVEVRLWPVSNPPDYMVVDCSAPSNVWHYADMASLPGGTGAANLLYKTRQVLMKRMHARNRPWRMGSSKAERDVYSGSREIAHLVTFTNDYYIAVSAMTENQILAFSNGCFNAESTSLKCDKDANLPITSISYDDLRGSASSGIDWPSTGHAVSPGSVLGLLRLLTGIEFDLPTDAQWEFACRGGKDTTFCFGFKKDRLDEFAWWKESEGSSGRGRAFPVCLKKPNAYGLYDMHGNVYEWALDWARDQLPTDPVVEPVGPSCQAEALKASGAAQNCRIYRGGSFETDANYTKSAYRNCDTPTVRDYFIGFRLACPCPADVGR